MFLACTDGWEGDAEGNDSRSTSKAILGCILSSLMTDNGWPVSEPRRMLVAPSRCAKPWAALALRMDLPIAVQRLDRTHRRCTEDGGGNALSCLSRKSLSMMAIGGPQAIPGFSRLLPDSIVREVSIKASLRCPPTCNHGLWDSSGIVVTILSLISTDDNC